MLTPLEQANLLYSQWINSRETKGYVLNLVKQKELALADVMNLIGRKDVAFNDLLILLSKVKTLHETIQYVTTNPESILNSTGT